jgi:hypothetical protein
MINTAVNTAVTQAIQPKYPATAATRIAGFPSNNVNFARLGRALRMAAHRLHDGVGPPGCSAERFNVPGGNRKAREKAKTSHQKFAGGRPRSYTSRVPDALLLWARD